MRFPYTLRYFSGLAPSNDEFHDKVAAQSDHHYYLSEHEDHNDFTDVIVKSRDDHQGREKHVFSPYADAPLRPRARERQV